MLIYEVSAKPIPSNHSSSVNIVSFCQNFQIIFLGCVFFCALVSTRAFPFPQNPIIGGIEEGIELAVADTVDKLIEGPNYNGGYNQDYAGPGFNGNNYGYNGYYWNLSKSAITRTQCTHMSNLWIKIFNWRFHSIEIKTTSI